MLLKLTALLYIALSHIALIGQDYTYPLRLFSISDILSNNLDIATSLQALANPVFCQFPELKS